MYIYNFIFYIVELIAIFYLGNKIRHETDLRQFTELTEFNTGESSGIWIDVDYACYILYNVS